MKVYITFGQQHIHSVNGQTFDKNCVAVIEAGNYMEGRNLAFEAFNDQWCFAYSEADWSPEQMKYFPRGYINVN